MESVEFESEKVVVSEPLAGELNRNLDSELLVFAGRLNPQTGQNRGWFCEIHAYDGGGRHRLPVSHTRFKSVKGVLMC